MLITKVEVGAREYLHRQWQSVGNVFDDGEKREFVGLRLGGEVACTVLMEEFVCVSGKAVHLELPVA